MSEVKRYAIYSSGKWEAVVVKVGPWVKWRDFDAQRLRADTAEADALIQYAKRVVAVEELSAAKQRIANVSVILSRIIEVQKTDYSIRGGLPHRWECLIAEAEAALNPNPEAESQ